MLMRWYPDKKIPLKLGGNRWQTTGIESIFWHWYRVSILSIFGNTSKTLFGFCPYDDLLRMLIHRMARGIGRFFIV